MCWGRAVLNTQGYQVFCRPKVVTLVIKSVVNPEKFSSGEHRMVSDLLMVTEVRPEISREVTMKVFGLPFNAPNSVVQEQVELYGDKLKNNHPYP